MPGDAARSRVDTSGEPEVLGAVAEGNGTWCVLVAAGSGDRLGTEQPKAFAPLGGRPLLAESLERLDASDWIDALVVAVPADWVEPAILLAEELVASKVAAVVPGGATRAESVRAGLEEVSTGALVVVVHDAARPLVTDDVLGRVLGALGEGVDGAIPALPLADTVKRVSGGRVTATVDRADLVAVQTPQAFLANPLRAAYAGELAEATDCASLVERLGGTIAVVEGDPALLKVTTRADLERAEQLLAAERLASGG